MYVCVYIYITFYKGKTFIKRYSALKCERKKKFKHQNNTTNKNIKRENDAPILSLNFSITTETQ